MVEFLLEAMLIPVRLWVMQESGRETLQKLHTHETAHCLPMMMMMMNAAVKGCSVVFVVRACGLLLEINVLSEMHLFINDSVNKLPYSYASQCFSERDPKKRYRFY